MGVRVSGCGGRGSPQRFVSWERGGGFSLRVPVECARVLGHLRYLPASEVLRITLAVNSPGGVFVAHNASLS